MFGTLLIHIRLQRCQCRRPVSIILLLPHSLQHLLSNTYICSYSVHIDELIHFCSLLSRTLFFFSLRSRFARFSGTCGHPPRIFSLTYFTISTHLHSTICLPARALPHFLSSSPCCAGLFVRTCVMMTLYLRQANICRVHSLFFSARRDVTVVSLVSKHERYLLRWPIRRCAWAILARTRFLIALRLTLHSVCRCCETHSLRTHLSLCLRFSPPHHRHYCCAGVALLASPVLWSPVRVETVRICLTTACSNDVVEYMYRRMSLAADG